MKKIYVFLLIGFMITALKAQTVTDIDGNVYNTVTIGTQTWMAANLKTTHYADGIAIPAYYWYNYDSATNANTYGALYTWSAAMNGAASSSQSPSGIQGVCPTGWHLPSDDEWTTLTEYLGGDDVAGGKLKETGTTHWQSPNEGATNESGFTALPGGYRNYDGSFDDVGLIGLWWSSTEYNTIYAWLRYLFYNYSNVSRYNYNKHYGFSVRCLRDDKESVVTDYDGNIYNTVTIGTQTWMAENLKTTKYNDGTDIPYVTDTTAWINLTTPGYCWYNNDALTYKDTYGALYNWYTVNKGKLCPAGWHVPSDNEWTILTDWLGGEGIAGGKLKETDTIHWLSPNSGATNESGFTGLPGGIRHFDGKFYDIRNYGYWWCSTQYDINHARTRSLHSDTYNLFRDIGLKLYGFSVRCVNDTSAINPSVPDFLNIDESILYPNPATKRLYVKNINYANATIMIFDLQGKQVIIRKIDSESIDISNLRKGIYVVKLVCPENIMITKFIKE